MCCWEGKWRQSREKYILDLVEESEKTSQELCWHVELDSVNLVGMRSMKEITSEVFLVSFPLRARRCQASEDTWESVWKGRINRSKQSNKDMIGVRKI